MRGNRAGCRVRPRWNRPAGQWVALCVVSAGIASVLAVGSGVAAAALPSSDWPAYLGGPRHASYSASQITITPANATTLVRKWRFKTGSPYLASPTIAVRSVFIGSARGWFYKLNETTGKVTAKVYIGRAPALTCPASGVTSTATVASNARHVLTVYVAGGNGYLYALRASNLKVEWRSAVGKPSAKVNNYYNWSSPTVGHGKVYMGVSSDCDHPLIRGAVIAFNESTGAKIAQFFTVPAGTKNAGGSVWSSVGVAPNGDVYATTGNGPAARPRLGHSESIVKLDPVTLKLLGAYKVPAAEATNDGDFGASPLFFGSYVGACNKNGVFYALNQSDMKLAWSQRIANADGGDGQCLATPAYDGTNLFFGAQTSTIGTTTYPGSVQERVASTGVLTWSTPMTSGVLGSPSLDGGGLLVAGTFASATAGIYLIDSTTGTIVRKLMDGKTFGQSVFANNWLFSANTNGVTAWALPTAN